MKEIAKKLATSTDYIEALALVSEYLMSVTDDEDEQISYFMELDDEAWAIADAEETDTDILLRVYTAMALALDF